jgi:hypothetical protein
LQHPEKMPFLPIKDMIGKKFKSPTPTHLLGLLTPLYFKPLQNVTVLEMKSDNFKTLQKGLKAIR